MKFEYKDCIEKGLLRKIPSSITKAHKSIEKAKKWLSEAGKNLSSDSLDSCVISSYLAMFHAARAILIKDGFREKSHYCIARYLEEKYVKTNLLEVRFVNLLDHYRDLKHDEQYDVNYFATLDESQAALNFAKEFVAQIEKLLKKVLRRK